MTSYSDLPEHICFDILSRLPVKSVLRCRCVSKSWNALLSQPQFIRNHVRWSKILPQESPSPMLLHRRWYASSSLNDAHQVLDKITLSFKQLNLPAGVAFDSCFQCYGSCDGLLLVYGDDGKMFVFNPVTRDSRQVPVPAFTGYPNRTIPRFGLGYDVVNDDYNIVTVTFCKVDVNQFYLATEASVYSLKTGSFTWFGRFPSKHDTHLFAGSGVFVGGCINWFAVNMDEDNKRVVLAFDLVEHKFTEVPLPETTGGGNLTFNGCALCSGCLSI